MKLKLFFMAAATCLLAGILWVQLTERADRIAREKAAAEAAHVLQVQMAEEAKRQAAIDRENANAEAIRQLPETLHRIDESEQIGLIDSNKAQELRDVLLGKIPLYVLPDGTMTTNPPSKK